MVAFDFYTTNMMRKLPYTECMIANKDSVAFDNILSHIHEERVRAQLTNKSFELGILSDKQQSQVLELVESNIDTLKGIGMSKLLWHDDALRSSMKLAGEDLLISICTPRN